MGFRFRQGIRIFPGMRLNLSKSGVSASVGRPGATVNVSKKGVRGTVGIRGSGVSYSQTLYKRQARAAPSVTEQPSFSAAVEEEDATYNVEVEKLLNIVSRLVVEAQKGSTSWLQRTLKIGYNDAVELMYELEQRGVVSAPDGIGRRKVLATLDDLPLSND